MVPATGGSGVTTEVFIRVIGSRWTGWASPLLVGGGDQAHLDGMCTQWIKHAMENACNGCIARNTSLNVFHGASAVGAAPAA